MDKVKKYQKVIKKIIDKHYLPVVKYDCEEYELQKIIDDKNGHYILINVGWKEYERIFSCTLHIDLKGDKIWIRQDWTEGVVDDFIAFGVPKEDLILAFLAPYKRPYADIAA